MRKPLKLKYEDKKYILPQLKFSVPVLLLFPTFKSPSVLPVRIFVLLLTEFVKRLFTPVIDVPNIFVLPVTAVVDEFPIDKMPVVIAVKKLTRPVVILVYKLMGDDDAIPSIVFASNVFVMVVKPFIVFVPNELPIVINPVAINPVPKLICPVVTPVRILLFAVLVFVKRLFTPVTDVPLIFVFVVTAVVDELPIVKTPVVLAV